MTGRGTLMLFVIFIWFVFLMSAIYRIDTTMIHVGKGIFVGMLSASLVFMLTKGRKNDT